MLVSRLAITEDQALILICTIQKFSAQIRILCKQAKVYLTSIILVKYWYLKLAPIQKCLEGGNDQF